MTKFIGMYEDTSYADESLIGDRPGVERKQVVTLTSRFAVDEYGNVWRQGRWEADGSWIWLVVIGDDFQPPPQVELCRNGNLQGTGGWLYATNVTAPYHRKL